MHSNSARNQRPDESAEPVRQTVPRTDPQRMQCMEVWGGNQSTDSAFEMPQLRVRIRSTPFADSEGGGDVYYVSSCSSGRITRVLLADVSGHGQEVSRTGVRLRELMRKNINFIDQSRLVSAVNQQFGELTECGGFATALISTFFSPTRTLTLCNAGHPLPLFYRAKTRTWSVLDAAMSQPAARNLPLGITDTVRFSEFKVRLDEGDLLLYYTDALSEAQTESAMLGTQGLLRMVEQLGDPSPAELIPRILDRVASVSGDSLGHDDLTIMLLEGAEVAVRTRDNLAAPFRYLRHLFRLS